MFYPGSFYLLRLFSLLLGLFPFLGGKMLCSIKKRKLLFSSFFFLFSLLFSSLFLDVKNSFATDPSYTITSNTSNVTLCDDSDPTSSYFSIKCSDFSYLTIQSSGFTGSDRNETLQLFLVSHDVWSYYDNIYLFFKPFVSYFSDYERIVINNSSFSGSGKSITFTFSSQPLGCSGIVPSGSLSISSNGTFDVTNYSEAIVDVPAEVIPGDYHDDLSNIVSAIYVCGAILLVLYFFYCFYRLIIKGSGVS